MGNQRHEERAEEEQQKQHGQRDNQRLTGMSSSAAWASTVRMPHRFDSVIDPSSLTFNAYQALSWTSGRLDLFHPAFRLFENAKARKSENAKSGRMDEE